MLIEDFTNYDALLSEKQIQPAQGKTEGNILIIGGSPGSGKNWVVDNLTDIKNRYKVFDVDQILEIAATMKSSKFIESFKEYLLSMEDKVIGEDFYNTLEKHGVLYFLKSPSANYNQVLRDFLEHKSFYTKKKMSFLKATLDGTKPNVALNGTLRHTKGVQDTLKSLSEFGYDTDNNVDFLFVLTPTQEAVDNALKRAREVRNVDKEFLLKARDASTENMLSIMKGESELSQYTRDIFVVFNSKDDSVYYPDTSVVKDFKYVKLKPNDQQKIDKIEKLLKTTYA